MFAKAGITSPPTNFAEILSDAKKINALGGDVNGFTFAGQCQGCLGFSGLPSIWATKTYLITGNLPQQKANIVNNAALKAWLTLYRAMWANKLVPPSARTESGTTWGKQFLAGKVGIAPLGYMGVKAGLTSKNKNDFGVVPLPGPTGGFSTFDGGDDFAIPNGAKNASGAWEFIKFVLQKKEQLKYPDAGYTPIRTDLLDASYKSAHPFNAVFLKALEHGYAPTTLAYNAAFNQTSGPWFTMFTQAVYNGDINGALTSGQSGFSHILSQSGSGS